MAATLRVNGTSSSLTCSLTGPATSADDALDGVTVNDLDLLDIQISSGAGGYNGPHYGIVLDVPQPGP